MRAVNYESIKKLTVKLSENEDLFKNTINESLDFFKYVFIISDNSDIGHAKQLYISLLCVDCNRLMYE